MKTNCCAQLFYRWSITYNQSIEKYHISVKDRSGVSKIGTITQQKSYSYNQTPTNYSPWLQYLFLLSRSLPQNWVIINLLSWGFVYLFLSFNCYKLWADECVNVVHSTFSIPQHIYVEIYTMWVPKFCISCVGLRS